MDQGAGDKNEDSSLYSSLFYKSLDSIIYPIQHLAQEPRTLTRLELEPLLYANRITNKGKNSTYRQTTEDSGIRSRGQSGVGFALSSLILKKERIISPLLM